MMLILLISTLLHNYLVEAQFLGSPWADSSSLGGGGSPLWAGAGAGPWAQMVSPWARSGGGVAQHPWEQWLSAWAAGGRQGAASQPSGRAEERWRPLARKTSPDVLHGWPYSSARAADAYRDFYKQILSGTTQDPSRRAPSAANQLQLRRSFDAGADADPSPDEQRPGA